jgi:hypothetical protein
MLNTCDSGNSGTKRLLDANTHLVAAHGDSGRTTIALSCLQRGIDCDGSGEVLIDGHVAAECGGFIDHGGACFGANVRGVCRLSPRRAPPCQIDADADHEHTAESDDGDGG